MVDECHRLGKKAVMHARGREATLFSALAGADVIFHRSWGDDACIEAMLDRACAVCPTLLVPYHNQIFTQPSDPMYHKVRPDLGSREWAAAMDFLPRAYRAGVPLHDRHRHRLRHHALRRVERPRDRAVRGAAGPDARRGAQRRDRRQRLLPQRRRSDRTPRGRLPRDFIVFDGNPLANVSLLLDKERIKHVYLGGRAVELDLPPITAFGVSDFSYKMWHDTYTQSRGRAARSRHPAHPGRGIGARP